MKLKQTGLKSLMQFLDWDDFLSAAGGFHRNELKLTTLLVKALIPKVYDLTNKVNS